VILIGWSLIRELVIVAWRL